MITTAGTLVGGIGLFLLAMKLITDGLRLAVGDALRDILGDWTRSPARGILSGAAITSLVQSSSAVTVATIGFVNAGLLTLYQALGAVYGANIGTTSTAALAAIGATPNARRVAAAHILFNGFAGVPSGWCSP